MGHNLLLLSEDTEVLETWPTHQGVSCIRGEKHVDAYACVQNEKWLQQRMIIRFEEEDPRQQLSLPCAGPSLQCGYRGRHAL